MKGREGKQRVACCCSAARWKPSSGPLLHQRFWKMWLSWDLWRLPVKHPPCRPCIFDVQFRPCLLLALLLNSTFCPSWQLLKKAGLHLLELCRITGGGGPIPHSPSRDLLFWWPCHLHSRHLPSCFQRAALPRRQENPWRGRKKVKEISSSVKEAHSFYLMYSIYPVSPTSFQERPPFGDC